MPCMENFLKSETERIEYLDITEAVVERKRNRIYSNIREVDVKAETSLTFFLEIILFRVQ